MRRPDPTETALDALREAADMKPFLRHKSHLVVAKAAARATGCTQELVEAFRRLLEDQVKRDPGCLAKMAIVRRLLDTDEAAPEVYFAGARYIQMEPVWGGQEDTARELRGLCVIGLVRMTHPEALLEAVRLLCDSTAESRTGALRALAESGKAEAELLLRYKAMLGDRKIEVTGECFAAILRLGPRERALPFVAEFLGHRDEEVAEAAAIALGESRLTEAWPILRSAWERARSQSAILLGMALLRTEESIDFLMERVAHDRERVAASAIEALALYRNDETVRLRLEDAVNKREGPELRKALQSYWAGTG
jgi:HEAT repeat protein